MPAPTRPEAAPTARSRRRTPARRRVAVPRGAARARSAASARLERRRIRLATRDTGSARPARSRDGRWSGVHGHDGGDADVRSCSADGQGENSRFTRMACSRRAECDMSNRSVAVWSGSGDVSRKCRTAAPWELGRCRNWSDATGALPRSPAGADPSRGVRRMVLHGARRFVSPRAAVEDGTLVLPRVDARSVDAERCRTDGRNEYRQQSRFAQPTREAANFVPEPRRLRSATGQVGSAVGAPACLSTIHQCLLSSLRPLPRRMFRRRSRPPCTSIDSEATWAHCSTG